MTLSPTLLYPQQAEAQPSPAPTPPSILPLSPGDRGPDVSSYQPNVDWAAVANSGCKFAFVKATESTNYLNPYFERDWQRIHDNGLVRGTYHFARPDSHTPQAEADWFLANVPYQPGDLLVLDLEAGSGDLASWAITFAALVHDRTSIMPMLYSGPWFLQPHGLYDVSVAAAFGNQLWLAAYQSSTPEVPAGWSEITFWQNTDSASIPGVPGACDESIYKP
jgi:lysozyme